ncbi:MAG: glyoxalase superfamily protein [Pseudomonadota bacterium]
MNISSPLPSIDALKTQAKRLRQELADAGTVIGHSRSLEMLAHQHGYKDWNTLHAAVGNRPPTSPVVAGQRVSGQYLGQPFEGEVRALETFSQADRFRVVLHFDEPVDVVTFDSFSAFRQRVSCFIGHNGMTAEKTSNGEPQLRLQL